MPSAVLAAATPGALAHRRPLHQTNRGQRGLRGALLTADPEDGCAPMGRFSPHPTVLRGWLSRPRGSGRVVQSAALGPLVPAATVRRYQPPWCRRLAHVSTALGSLARGDATGCVRLAPVAVHGVVGITGPYTHPRISAESDTQAMGCPSAAPASRQAGLGPSRPSATTSWNGRPPASRRTRNRATAHGGSGCKPSSEGP